MDKEQAINTLINKIYSYSNGLIITKTEIKEIEKYYKNNSSKYQDLESFLDSNMQISHIVNKLKSGKDEIEKQLYTQKALQPGILTECVFMQTLSQILKLTDYIDLERTFFTEIPIEFKSYLKYLKPTKNTICAARYLYYNKKNRDTFIIQYGNPQTEDAVAIIHTNQISIEIKDMPALLMDTDLVYDEEGKIITDDINQKFPEYIKIIEDFNRKTSIIEQMGHNYKLFDTEIRNSLLKSYLSKTNVDLMMTTTGKNDDLIVIKTKDFGFVFSDGTSLISTKNSEIRTTGKNFRLTVFTPKYLETILSENDIMIIDDNTCRVDNNNKKIIGKVCGRGKDSNSFTRLKISNAFFVQSKNITTYKDKDKVYYEFPKDKICQSKSGISLHISITKTKNDIKNELYQFVDN